MNNTNIYSHIYPITYNTRVHILQLKRLFLHLQYYNKKLILLPYVTSFYSIFTIEGITYLDGDLRSDIIYCKLVSFIFV